MEEVLDDYLAEQEKDCAWIAITPRCGTTGEILGPTRTVRRFEVAEQLNQGELVFGHNVHYEMHEDPDYDWSAGLPLPGEVVPGDEDFDDDIPF